MRRLLVTIALIGSVALCGCRSRFVQATITNQSAAAISVVQVEYPSASFGTQGLRSGESFRYRFKLLGSGPVKVTWTDAQQHEHVQTGPTLDEGSEGTLSIDFPTQDHADFQTHLIPR